MLKTSILCNDFVCIMNECFYLLFESNIAMIVVHCLRDESQYEL